MSTTKCADLAIKKFNLEQEDADALVEMIRDRAKSFREGDVRVTIKQLAKVITAEQKFFARQKKLSARRNILKEREKNALMLLQGERKPKSWLQKKFKKYSMRDSGFLDSNLKAFLAGSTHERFMGQLSIHGRQLAKFRDNYNSIFRHLMKVRNFKDSELHSWVNDDQNINDVILELFGPNGEGFSIENPTMKSGNETAFEFARAYVMSKRKMVDEINTEGGAIGWLEDHVTSQYHDQVRVFEAGKTQFKSDLMRMLNEERTFGIMTDAEREKFLDAVYENIVSGKRRVTDDAPFMKSPQALVTKLAQHRKLHFKSADAWVAYQKLYGHRDLKTALMNGLKNLGDETVLVQQLGTNPDSMIEKLIAHAQQAHVKSGKSPDTFDTAGIRARYRQVTGEAYHIDSDSYKAPSIARYTGYWQAWQNMSKLGSAVIASISDIGSILQTAAYNGMNPFEAISTHLSNVMRRYDREELLEALSYLDEGFEHIIGGFHNRFGAGDYMPGMVSDMQDKFFRLNGLTAWTNSNRNAYSLMMSKFLGKQLSNSYEQLNPNTKRALLQYGLGEREFNILKQAGVKEVKGPQGQSRYYLTPDTIDDLVETTTDAALKQEYTETANRLRVYFTQEARIAVPEPGANERAFQVGNSERGTLGRSARELFWQFRSFPLTYMMKMGPRYQQMGKGYTIASMLGMTMLGYTAMSIKDILKGKKPRTIDPTDPMAYKTYVAAFTYSGAGGIIGDFILNDFGRYGVDVAGVLGGPTASVAEDFATFASALATGDDFASEAFNALVRNTPYANLFYTRTALDYMILYNLQEAFNPGYLRRMERRMKRDAGQEFIREPIDMRPISNKARRATWDYGPKQLQRVMR